MREKWDNLSSYDVHTQINGHENVKNSSFSLFYADDSKRSIKVWTKYLSVSKRSYLALLENIIDYLVLSYH